MLPTTAHLQYKASMRVSVTGKLSSGDRTMSVPVSINENRKCLRLNTGLAVYMAERGSGAFVLGCRTSNVTPDVEIKLFPNPVYTYARLVSMALLSQESLLSITVLDAAGRVILALQRPADQLYAGITIEMNRLGAGSYFLRIDGKTIHRGIPFIKVN